MPPTIQESPPFTRTGVDFTGVPQYKTKSNTSDKVYVCLFTYAVRRAIHLVVITDLSRSTFLQDFCRFAARRSVPAHLISDNGAKFINTSAETATLGRTHRSMTTWPINTQYGPSSPKEHQGLVDFIFLSLYDLNFAPWKCQKCRLNSSPSVPGLLNSLYLYF